MKTTIQISVITLLVLGCAERQARLWIEPPIGFDPAKAPRNLVYNVENVESGKKESVLIPLNQVPQNLVLEGGPTASSESEQAAATKADQYLKEGKLPAGNTEGKPSVSYLKGVDQVQSLYTAKKYNEALIALAPLVEQYPTRAKLFTMQGTLYRKLGEKKLAYQSFKKSHELDASNPAVEEAAASLAAEVGENQ